MNEELDVNLVDEILNIGDLSIECADALNEFENVVSLEPAMMESASVEGSDITALKFEDAEQSLWQKIKEKLKKFFKWIKSLFESLWEKVRTIMMDTNAKWFESHRYELKNAMERKSGDNTNVKIRNYNIEINIVESFNKDIVLVYSGIDKMYSLGEKLIETILNTTVPEKHRFWSIGRKNAKKELMDEIVKIWNEISNSLNLKLNPGEELSSEDAKNAILAKYFNAGYIDKSQPTVEVSVSSFVSDFNDAEWICSKKGTAEIKRMCESMKRNSGVMEIYLRELESFTMKLERQNVGNGDKKVKELINTIKSTVVAVLQSISKLSLSLGTQYWALYMNLRSDTLKACKVWYSIYKKDRS